MRQSRPATVTAWALILVALAAAVPVLGARWAVERGTRRVELAVDYAAVSAHSANPGATLQELAVSGATAAVVDAGGAGGIDPALREQLAALGLAPLPRLPVDGGLAAAAAMIRALPATAPGATGVLLRGPRLPDPDPGQPDPLAAAMRQHQYLLYLPEDPRNPAAVELPGLDRLAVGLDYRAARAYAVSPLTAGPDGVAEALGRARLAVRDRNVRVLIVGPPPDGGPGAAIADTRALLFALATQLRDMGYLAGPPAPLPPLPAGPWQLGLAGLGALGAGLLYLALLVPLPPGRIWQWLLSGAVLAGVAGVLWAVRIAPYTGPQLLALAAAVLFPAAAAALVLARWADPQPGRTGAGEGLLAVAATAGLALAGGTLVAALLAHPRYMLQVEGFRGVKAALLLPPILAALAALRFRRPRRANGEHVSANGAVLRPAWQAASGWVAALVAVAILYWIVQRSGNLPAGSVPDWERRLRTLLDQALGVRPRFKEVLLGYPALGLAAAAAVRGRRAWAVAGAVAGTLAGASVVNTFAHLHSPLGVSLLRTFHGLWIGALAALAAAWAGALLWRR